jgi:hypothetical protein
MDSEKYLNYLESLEIPETSTLSEIKQAYAQLKQLYSSESIVTVPLQGEISAGRKVEILQEIEEAYRGLLGLYRGDRQGAGRRVRAFLNQAGPEETGFPREAFSGSALREVRTKLGIDLHDIALATNIRIQYLENIEDETFADLPPDVYARGFVVSYAKYLSLDSKSVADDYMKRYNAWTRAGNKKK